MTTQQEREDELMLKHGEAVAKQWMKDHREDFEPTKEHGNILGEWLAQNHLVLTYENLDKAFAAKKAEGVSFITPKTPRSEWEKRHFKDFDGSPESNALINQYLSLYHMAESAGNLEQAFQAIRGEKGPKVFTRAFAASVSSASDDLSWVPSYMSHIKTSKDIRNLSPETAREWRRGPDKDAFYRRLEEIKARGL